MTPSVIRTTRLRCARGGDFGFTLFLAGQRAPLLRHAQPANLTLGEKIAAVFFDDLLFLERAARRARLVERLGRRTFGLLAAAARQLADVPRVVRCVHPVPSFVRSERPVSVALPWRGDRSCRELWARAVHHLRMGRRGMRAGFSQVDGSPLAIDAGRGDDLRRTRLDARTAAYIGAPEVAPIVQRRGRHRPRRLAMRLGSGASAGRAATAAARLSGFALDGRRRRIATRIGCRRLRHERSGDFGRTLALPRSDDGVWVNFQQRKLRCEFPDGFGRVDFGRRECGSWRFARFGRRLDARLEKPAYRRCGGGLSFMKGETKVSSCRGFLRFEMERLRRFTRRRGGGFRVTPAHHGRIEALLDDGAGAGLDHRLLAQHRVAMRCSSRSALT